MSWLNSSRKMFSENIDITSKCFRNKIQENDMKTRRDYYNEPISLTNLTQQFRDREFNPTAMTLIAVGDDDSKGKGRGRGWQRVRATGRSNTHFCCANRLNVLNQIPIRYTLVIIFIAFTCLQAYNCDITKTSPGAKVTSNQQGAQSKTSSNSQHASSQGSSALKSQKENLLASLANSIELQHFGLAPIKSLVHQRPSKFDSISEGLHDNPFETSKLSIVNEHSSKNHQVSKSSTSKNGKLPAKKSEDSMRQIMQMHEIASAHSVPSKHISKPPKVGSTIGSPSDSSSRIHDLSKFHSIVKNPSHLISRVLQTKTLASILPTFTRHESDSPLNLSSLVRSSSLFSGRANYGSDLRPPYGTDHGSKTQSGKLIINKDLRPQAYVLAPLNDDPVQSDLEAHDSKKDSIEPSKASPKPNRSEMDTTESIKGVDGSKKPLMSWLKMSQMKPLRASFVQESLRDLITLSQLPIMPGNPISTAPSVYEKGGKLWLDDKQDNPNRLGGNRTRTFDDILRFIYLLSTSSRRKRDPLEAMSSQPPTLVSALVSQASSALRTRPFKFKDRPKSDRKLSYWIKGDRSPLRTKDAMPRGVMWEMATDPSLAVTVFHLLERASVALPLGEC